MSSNRFLHLKIRKLKRRSEIVIPGRVEPLPSLRATKPNLDTFARLYGESDLGQVAAYQLDTRYYNDIIERKVFRIPAAAHYPATLFAIFTTGIVKIFLSFLSAM